MKTNQKVWKGLEELENSPEFEKQKHNEFPEKLPAVEEVSNDLESMKAPRRDFLKMMGFSLTAATVASCQMPVKKVIPFNFSKDYSTYVAKLSSQDNGPWTFSSEKSKGKSISEFIKVLELIVKSFSSDYLKLTDDSSVDNSNVKKEVEKSLKEIEKLDEIAKSFANKIHSINRKFSFLTYFIIFIISAYVIIYSYY